MTKRNLITTAVALAVLLGAGVVAAPYLLALLPAEIISTFSYTSELGEHVGGGDSQNYSKTNSQLSLTGDLAAVEFSVKTDSGYWSIRLQAPNGEKLHLGRYDKITATAAGTGKLPLLKVISNGNECNEVYGNFSISQLQVDEAGKVTALAAEFVQSCESSTAPVLRGYIQYQIPVVKR